LVAAIRSLGLGDAPADKPSSSNWVTFGELIKPNPVRTGSGDSGAPVASASGALRVCIESMRSWGRWVTWEMLSSRIPSYRESVAALRGAFTW